MINYGFGKDFKSGLKEDNPFDHPKKKLNKKNIFIIFVILLIVVSIFGIIVKYKIINYNPNNKDLTNLEILQNDVEEQMANEISFEEATVTRIVDGDTIVVNISGKDKKIRFIGINTPEYTTKVEYYGKEATEFTKKMLDGKTIYLEKDVSETDEYGRLLRYVWLEKPLKINETEIKNKMFNAILLSNGYANKVKIKPDTKYYHYFSNIEKEAKKEKIGIWQ